MDDELHERHIRDLGCAARHGASREGGAEGEQAQGPAVPPSRSRKLARGVGVESCGGDGQACEDGEDQRVASEGGKVVSAVWVRPSARPLEDSMITIPRGIISTPSRVRPTTIGMADSLPKTAETRGIPM